MAQVVRISKTYVLAQTERNTCGLYAVANAAAYRNGGSAIDLYRELKVNYPHVLEDGMYGDLMQRALDRLVPNNRRLHRPFFPVMLWQLLRGRSIIIGYSYHPDRDGHYALVTWDGWRPVVVNRDYHYGEVPYVSPLRLWWLWRVTDCAIIKECWVDAWAV